MASAEVKATYLSSGIWTEKKLCTTKQQNIPYQNVLATQISFFYFNGSTWSNASHCERLLQQAGS